MKKIQKIISGALITGLVLSSAGCGKKSEVSNTDGKMTIKWLGIPYFASSEDGSYAQKVLEEKFNIKISPVFLDDEGYNNKKPIMMSGGEIPDIIYELDPSDVQSDARQKFLAEITYDELKENIPDYVKYVTETAPQAWLYSYYDGKNYGVPNMYYGGKDTAYGVWRMDWLKNIGIDKVPETIDEMEKACEKIVNNDPDKNGKKDTYAMSGDVKTRHFCFSEIFGAYGVLPFDWMEKDGKVVYGGTQPEMKETLTTLARWYKKGIISPDFITDSTNTNITDKFSAGQLGYMNVCGFSYDDVENQTMPTTMISKLKSVVPNAEIAVAKHPVGPNGKKGSFAWGQAGHIVAMGRQVEKEPEKKKKIFEIIKALSSDKELITKVEMGEKDTHYKLLEGQNDKYEYISPYDDPQTRQKKLGLFGIGSTSFFGIIPAKPEITNKYASNTVLDFQNKYREDDAALYDTFLKPDVVPETEKYLADLRNRQLVYITKIIRGEKDVDYYDEFINEWKNQGGQTLEENANKTNELYNNVLQKLK